MSDSSTTRVGVFSDKTINLLGPLAAKLPFPFSNMVVFAIKHIKPNRLFSKIKSMYYKYSIENTIFKLRN